MPRPIEIKVTSDTSAARRDLSGISTDLAGMETHSAGLVGSFKKLGAALLAGGALAKAGGYLKDAAFAASDMNETISKTRTLFGKDAGGIIAWAKTSDAALVSTERKVLDVVGGFNLLLGNKGINGSQGREWSRNLTNLSADLASFFNTDFDQAAAAISSAMKGEMDPIEAYGVSINDAALKVKAFQLGLYSGKGALDATTKAQAAYALIMEQTAKAQGDVNRTQGGMANQWRIMQTNLDEIKTTIGQSLTPLAEAVLPVINDLLEDANTYLGSEGFKGLVTDIGDKFKTDIAPAVKDFTRNLGNVNVEDIKKDFGWLKDAADQIGEGAKKIWAAWDNLSPSTKANIATLVAAGAALKALTAANPVIKIGVNLVGEVITTAATSFTSALINSVVPMKVWVVNQTNVMDTLDSPSNKGRLSRIVGGLVAVSEVATLASLAWAGVQASARAQRPQAQSLADALADIKELDARISGLGSTTGKLDKRVETYNWYRIRGDRTNYENYMALWKALRDGPRVGLPSLGGPPIGMSASSSSALPIVTDEQIARAVYATLLRSGVRNGTALAVI